uniref:Ankyrin repeat domain-containing protein 53 n=1 Tax=Salvator merianae TaxID=96440 RepID=A0A8D0C925_SALMN
MQNLQGVSPLHKAASEGYAHCVRALIKAGADIHARDADGQEPIDLSRMWGHRVCARYLADAMWKLNKATFAQNVSRLNEIKAECKMKEQEFLEKEQTKIDFCSSLAFDQWLATKRLPPLPERIHRLLGAKRQSLALRGYGVKTLGLAAASKSTEVPQELPGLGAAWKGYQGRPWNVSTNLSSAPATCIFRPTAVRLGVEPEQLADHDFTSFLFLFEDAFGEPQIQVDNMGNLPDVPPLPLDVIKRSLYPCSRVTRLSVPQDLKPLHLLDLQHRRPPGPEQKWTDQMALSLRQTLDPVFLDTLKAHVSTYSDPKVLSPRPESDQASGQETGSPQSPASSWQE